MEYMATTGNNNNIQDPISVLVVGGGDGYVVSELLKHPFIASIDHVDLDEEVINVSKQHFAWADAWEDERVNLIIGDGAAFVKEQSEKGQSYNVIIQDASDPFYLHDDGSKVVLPSSVLYDESHFESLHKLLRPKNGVLMFQAETYNIPSDLEEMRKWRQMLQKIGFVKPRYGSISIATYPTGQIGFVVAHARDGKGEDKICKSDDKKIVGKIMAKAKRLLHRTKKIVATCNDDGSGDCKMDASPEMNWSIILALFDKDLLGKTLYYHPRIHRR